MAKSTKELTPKVGRMYLMEMADKDKTEKFTAKVISVTPTKFGYSVGYEPLDNNCQWGFATWPNEPAEFGLVYMDEALRDCSKCKYGHVSNETGFVACEADNKLRRHAMRIYGCPNYIEK